MSVWAIADLHLSFGTPNKKMDVFGERWRDHAARLKQHWLASVQAEDLVLLPGDISWAMHLHEVQPDLEWIDALPGTKVMIRGNHDYWWQSLSKIEKIRPPSIHYMQNSAFLWNDVAIGGTRLWDSSEFHFRDLIEDPPVAWANEQPQNRPEDQVIFDRELVRLENSLKEMKKLQANTYIAMTHYPPVDTNLGPSRAADIISRYGVQHCVFGHIHNVKKGISFFGVKNGVNYQFVAGDYLDFRPLKII